MRQLRREPVRFGRSAVCIEGGQDRAIPEAEYDAFVQYPTGAVERVFGEHDFRVDVSAGINTGRSWQLPLFMAHALEAAEALATPSGEPASDVGLLLATGLVRSVDLVLGDVGEIPVKLDRALPEIETALAAGRPVCLMVPPGNLEDIPPARARDLEARGVRIVAPADAAEAAALLGASLPPLSGDAAEKPEASWEGNPYPGLAAFDTDTAAVFFGRGRAREETLERLRRGAAQGVAAIVVHGRSGAGKSSLARAGLLPDVQRHAHEGAPWTVIAPSVAFALESAIREIDDAIDTLPADGTVLVLLDQFEQVFGASKDVLEALDATLDRAIATGRIWIVATLRSDQLSGLDRLPRFSHRLGGDRFYRLPPPNLYELSEMISAPAALAGLSFERDETLGDLATAIAGEALDAPEALPLLQICLRRLVEQSGSDGILTFAAYERLGGLAGAAARWAEVCVDRSIRDQRTDEEKVDRALAAAISIDPGTGTALSRSIPVGELPANIGHVLEGLVEDRLFTADAADGQRILTLAHDSLIRTWPRLKRLAEDKAEAILLRDRLDEAAANWRREGEKDEDIIRNLGRLTSAEALLAEGLVDVTPDAQRYVARSRTVVDDETKTRERRPKIIAAIAISVAIAMAALGGWALQQRNETKKRADLLRILATERLVSEGEFDKALLELIDASQTFSTGEAPDSVLIAFEGALREAIDRDREVKIIPKHDNVLYAPQTLWLHNSKTGVLSRLRESGGFETLGQLKGILHSIHPLPDGSTTLFALQSADELGFVEVFEDGTLRRRAGIAAKSGDEAEWLLIPYEDGQWDAKEFDLGFDSYNHPLPDAISAMLTDSHEYLAEQEFDRAIVLDLTSRGDQELGRGPVPRDPDPEEDWIEDEFRGCSGAEPGEFRYEAIRNAFADPEGPKFWNITCDWESPSRVLVSSMDFGVTVRRQVHLIEFEWLYEENDIIPYPDSITSALLASGEGVNDRTRFYATIEDPEYSDSALLVAAAHRDLLIVGRGSEPQKTVRMPSEILGVLRTGQSSVTVVLRNGPTPETQELVTYHHAAHLSHPVFAVEDFSVDSLRSDNLDGTHMASSVICVSDAALESARSQEISQVRAAGIDLPRDPTIADGRFCLYAPPFADSYVLNTAGRIQVFSRNGEPLGILNLERWSAEFLDGVVHKFVLIDGNRVLLLALSESGEWRASEVYSSPLPILDAALSPSGKRLLIAASDDNLYIEYEIISLEANRIWRQLAASHRRYTVFFMTEDVFVAGDFYRSNKYRLPELDELRALAQEYLSPHCRYQGADPRLSDCWRG